MRILLDENLDEEFPELLGEFDATHLRAIGWKGLKNGELLDALESAGFNVLVTVDKQMRFQQNIRDRAFALIVLDIHPAGLSNQIACLARLKELLSAVHAGEIHVIEGPHPARKPSV